MKRLKSIFSILMISTLLSQNNITVHAEDSVLPNPPAVVAEAGIVMDASTGAVLYNKNMNDKHYPASITKILTSLVALENGNLSDMVTFSHNAVYSLEYGDANIAMKEGEQLSLQDCMYGMLLASANEVCNGVAEHIAGSTEAFATMMNERAKKAGAVNSNFVNANGLYNENHYTTCYDMAMITKDAIKNDQFLKVEANTTYTIAPTNLTPESRPLTNRHKMMFPLNKVYYEGIIAGKTGYTSEAGNTLVTVVKRGDMTLICVVMKSDTYDVYSDTSSLLDYAFNNYEVKNISENETKFNFDNMGFFSSLGDVFQDTNTLITINPQGNVVLPKGVDFSSAVPTLEYVDNSEGDSNVVANLNYTYNGNYIGGTTLELANPELDEFDFGPSLSEETKNIDKDSKNNTFVINIWILLSIIVLAFFIFLLIRYMQYTKLLRKRRKRHRQHVAVKKRNRRRRR